MIDPYHASRENMRAQWIGNGSDDVIHVRKICKLVGLFMNPLVPDIECLGVAETLLLDALLNLALAGACMDAQQRNEVRTSTCRNGW